MRIHQLILCIALAAGMGPLQSAPQNIGPAHSENLQNCLEGFAGCDYVDLDPQEKQAVQSIRQENNFMDCFQGFSDCHQKQLNAEQQEEVTSAHRIQNLQNCIDGIGECDAALLTMRNTSRLPGQPVFVTSRPAWREQVIVTRQNSMPMRDDR